MAGCSKHRPEQCDGCDTDRIIEAIERSTILITKALGSEVRMSTDEKSGIFNRIFGKAERP